MRTKVPISVIAMILLLSQSSHAQPSQNADSIAAMLGKVFERFQSTSNVSFDIHYTYSNESSPGIILDSLVGTFDKNGNYCHFTLDSTETIKTERCTIVLFHEDKIMYLTKASSQFSDDPLTDMTAYFSNNKNVTCVSSISGQLQQIIITYPPGQSYKQIEISVDLATGYIQKAVYLIQTSLLMEKDWTNPDSSTVYDDYARVEAQFSNYHSSNTDTSFFNERKFFYKEGSQYKVTDNYRDFKIFIGSSNL